MLCCIKMTQALLCCCLVPALLEMEHWLLGIAANRVSWSTGLPVWGARLCLSLLAAHHPSVSNLECGSEAGSASCESGLNTEAACFKGKGGTTVSSKSPDSMPYSDVNWWNFCGFRKALDWLASGVCQDAALSIGLWLQRNGGRKAVIEWVRRKGQEWKLNPAPYATWGNKHFF